MGDFLTALSIAGQCALGITGVTVVLVMAVAALNRLLRRIR